MGLSLNPRCTPVMLLIGDMVRVRQGRLPEPKFKVALTLVQP